MVEAALLDVVRPAAVEAAQRAQAQASTRRDDARDAMVRDLEAARYAADRAFRQYDAADPENRFVAGEREARSNHALTRGAACEARVAEHDAATLPPAPALVSFDALAKDFRAVWSAPTTDARLKKRIVRTLVHEALADIDDGAAEIVLTLHWVGGANTEHRLPRRRRGQRTSTPADPVQAVRSLALIARDDVIAGVLNRNGLKTGPRQPLDPQARRLGAVELPHTGLLRPARRRRTLAEPQPGGRPRRRSAPHPAAGHGARRAQGRPSSSGRPLGVQPRRSW